MMQRRPRSEGRFAATSRSLDAPTLRALQDASDVGDDADGGWRQELPRRPRTTPKARTQRYVLGVGSAQVTSALPRQEVFMTHLPDSPPRKCELLVSGEEQRLRCDSSDEESDKYVAASGFTAIEAREQTLYNSESAELDETSLESTTGQQDESRDSNGCAAASACVELIDPLEPDSDGHRNADDSNSSHDETLQIGAEVEVTTVDDFDERQLAAGPVVNDLVCIGREDNGVDSIRESEDEGTVQAASTRGPEMLELCPETSDDVTDEDPDYDLDSSFQELLDARRRIEEEELRRAQIRHELEVYVGSLTARRDEDGERLVEFPRNYKQILALMTERDMREEDLEPPSQQLDRLGSSDRQKSWSRVLIQNGLAKQQAFGRLDEEDEDTDGVSALSAKIAIKMARIRQLDAILEEKLGKNLYASTTTGKPQPREQQKLHAINRTRLPPSNASSRADGPPVPILPCPGVKNFVERNKKVVENGANAKLTREEEQRLRALLRDGSSCSSSDPDDSLRDTPLFTLDGNEKEEIERLLTEKRGVYHSALLPPTDEEEVGTETESREKAPNIIQENKRERLRKQRLRQIDEELEFLREHETVPIIPDDDVADDTSDGCSTERSFMTTTSLMSTCSTRSGVTRRQLNEFVAAEVGKASDWMSRKASPDEIQSLLSSLSHVSISRPTTTV